MGSTGDSSAIIELPGFDRRPADAAGLRGLVRLIVPSVKLRCPQGHELELPAEYAARRAIFCPHCRRAFRPNDGEVAQAGRLVRVGMPGKLHLALPGRRRGPEGQAAVAPAADEPAPPAPAVTHGSERAGALIRISPRAFRRLVSASGWTVSCALHALLFLAAALLGLAVHQDRPAEPEVILTATVVPREVPDWRETPRRRALFPSRSDQARAEPLPDFPEAAEPTVPAPDAGEPPADPVPDRAGPEPVIGEFGIAAAQTASSSRKPPGATARPERFTIGSRSSPELRIDAAKRGGGGDDTEGAVEKALTWLAAHQAADGSWRVSGDGASRRAEARGAEAGPGPIAAAANSGPNPYDLASSALATLAFLGAGQSHHQGRHRETVARAIEFLLSEQKPSGCWTTSPATQEMHVQGMAALALAEALLAAPKAEDADRLRAAAGRAARFIADAQYPLSGWGYTPYAVRLAPDEKPRPLDRSGSGGYVEQSVVIWNTMALKAARAAGIEVEDRAFQGIARWLDDGQGADGNYAYSGNLIGGRIVVTSRNSSPCMAAAALMARLWTGHRPDEPAMGRTATIVMDMLERNREVADAVGSRSAAKTGPDLYFLHHGSIALFQMGGDHWARWNQIMKPMVLKAQAADGSWAPSTYANGPTLATALGALVLESYYRYSPLYR
ncbi:MAG TPA: hypothetical protein PK280_14175 [Planctomycetota bacterium]|nr:hypothetical protein [Planctomycetota bacterium]